MSRTAKLCRNVVKWAVRRRRHMIVTDAKSFGEAIRKRRKQLGYTQAYLSEFTGMSVSFLSDLENGKPTIELEKAIRIANLLGLNCIVTER